MQCHVVLADLQEAAGVDFAILLDEELIRAADSSGTAFEANLVGLSDAWFDVGSWTERQREQVAFLVRNRVPFRCS